MHKLKETDREAVLLRYFENRQFAEVGAKLGLNENAARMRVERALEKLRDIFAKRGITTATALASVISANAIQIAPANLAATLTTASIATAGAGTFTLLKIITATKLKLAFSAIVIAGAATAFVHQQQTQNKLRAENESLQQQIAQLQMDNEKFSNQLANVGDSKKLSGDQFNELLKLRGEVGVFHWQTNDIAYLREENERLKKEITYLPGMTILETSLVEQELALQATNEIVERLAESLSVPEEIKANVYAYTNSTDANIFAYQPYFKAVQARDELYDLTTALAKKIAQEKSFYSF